MPAIRFTATLSALERDSLYLLNMPSIVLRYNTYVNQKRRDPSLSWFRKQLVFTESLPDCVKWEYDVDHIIPKKLGGGNYPENLIVIPSTMNRSFNKFVDKDKIAFLGKDIFDAASKAMKKRVDKKDQHNEFAMFAYNR